MSNETRAQSPIACDMSVFSPEQRETHLSTSRDLFLSLKQIRELSDGYEFRLDGSNVILKAAEFISLENYAVRFLTLASKLKPKMNQYG